MYSYDEFDRQMVRDRVARFRDQVDRRLAGALSEDEFKPLRLMNGVYLQLHAYMLRIAIPYGVLSSRQMRQLAMIAERYDRGYGHFTTRQNIQFNWPALKDIPDILDLLADVEMHAIQTSGNCIRNVTTDAFAGAAADEIVDPRATAELLRQWSTDHPEFSFLPRKFKIAITGAPNDRAAVKAHDIGILTLRNAAGEIGYQIMVGGGLGRTPMIGVTIADFVPQAELLRMLEAIMRVYNFYGRRDNKYKARIKILVHEIGADEMRARVAQEYARIQAEQRPDYTMAELARLAAFFDDGPQAEAEVDPPARIQAMAADPAFRRWCEVNLAPHRTAGYSIVTISLKPIGGAPGDATAAQMALVADLADRFSRGQIRVAHTQNLVLPHVRQADLPALFTALQAGGLAEANVDLITDIIACPGLDYCALATARSIPVAQAISQRFHDPERQRDIGPLSIKISGCINACGHHHIGHIGILGLQKNGQESYQVTLGGDPTLDAAIGQHIGAGLDADGVVDAIERIVAQYMDERAPGETFLAAVKRLGPAHFRGALSGSH